MASPHRKAYAYEKRLAKMFGGERIIDQSKKSCDVINNWLAIEAFQKKIPDYLKEELHQALFTAQQYGGLLPIAIWREKHKKDKDALIIVRLEDWLEWFGR